MQKRQRKINDMKVKSVLTRKEFIESVDIGNDVMFECFGKRFAVIMTDEGPDIAEQETCANRQTFKNAEQLLDQYNIDGVPLTKALSQCRFTFIS